MELAVRAGADVFARDRNGKAVYDSAGKDDRVKAFLRQCGSHDCPCYMVAHFVLVTNQDPSLLKPASDLAPPELRGYLNKYTNVARGYNTRWFVLKDDILSCASYCPFTSIRVLTTRQTTGTKKMSQ